MAILIIVEDGSIVADANSYITVQYVRNYALNRGLELPVSDDEVATMLIRATDYLEAQACNYQGSRVSPVQSLEFPRSGVIIHGELLPSNVIPNSLKNAQAQLVMAIQNGFDLQPTISLQDYVTEEKVGPITTKYADPTAIGVSAIFTAVDALLKPLFGECGSTGSGFRTIRV